jgi:hypothetical protein
VGLKVRGRENMVPVVELKCTEPNETNVLQWGKIFEEKIKTKVYKKHLLSNVKPFVDEVKQVLKKHEKQGALITQMHKILSSNKFVVLADVKKTRSMLVQANYKIEITFVKVRFIQQNLQTGQMRIFKVLYIQLFANDYQTARVLFYFLLRRPNAHQATRQGRN